MGKPSDYILLPRDIDNSRVWYKDHKTFHVFMWLLLSAYNTDTVIFGETIKRGSIVTKNSTIAYECGLTIDNVRKSLAYLQRIGEIKRERRYRNQVITVVNYEDYKDDNR